MVDGTRGVWWQVASGSGIVTITALSSLCLCISVVAATQQQASGHRTVFVTLPTLYDDQGTTTDYPITSPMSREGQSHQARSALLRPQLKDTKVVFLADDHKAASRIPELLKLRSERHDAFSLFPNTRSRPKGTVSARQDWQLGRSAEEQPKGADLMAESSRRSAAPRYWPRRPNVVASDDEERTNEVQRRRPRQNMTRVLNIEAECQDDFMKIHLHFNDSFYGLVYSSGYAYDGDCIYVNGTGRFAYDFFIQLNRCGTLGGDEQGQQNGGGKTPSMNTIWNTLTVQYNPLIEEVWDEHFKVTCEYGYDFWKTVTFPFLDVEVQTGNPVLFTMTPPECHMEIRDGIGPASNRVTTPVRVGDPLTLVIHMRSPVEGFDMVVSDCYAHNGGDKRIVLIDHSGCPLDESLIGHFEGVRRSEGLQVYASMKTFRFTGSPALYLECDVRMCHGDCPSQPCHWRRSKKQRRRAVREEEEGDLSNVSGSLSLFQSIQVVRDDHHLRATLRDDSEGKVCVRSGTFSAVAGMVAVVVGLLTAACSVLCLRLRRAQKLEEQPPLRTTSFITSDFVPPIKRRLD